jgi:hypothetical protein
MQAALRSLVGYENEKCALMSTGFLITSALSAGYHPPYKLRVI